MFFEFRTFSSYISVICHTAILQGLLKHWPWQSRPKIFFSVIMAQWPWLMIKVDFIWKTSYSSSLCSRQNASLSQWWSNCGSKTFYCKCGIGGRAFSYQAHLLWNHLPAQVQEADALFTFKTTVGLKLSFLTKHIVGVGSGQKQHYYYWA